MDKAKFISVVEKRLTLIFKSAKSGHKPSSTEKHRLEGFIQAGVFMGLVSQSEMVELMEQTHLLVFNKTIAERKADKLSTWQSGELDYSQFDSPTFERSPG
ncbi:hypothetical protein [Zhongshania aliphaticivorans]|uniref:hypothetical protein n=1 Tax=Zhongshania aliphaticivorans TaxID=1470434 RepID=UPI0012E50CB1|nr:hypothetical protein [Zhongshania aliphaticivorans]CAA0082991.1 Uncharacterised protein [Zhongshania aliphaticivorans]